MKINLNNEDWQVKGFWPWVPVKGDSMEIGNELMGVTDWLPATVPGGVHHDLFQAGLIPNPYEDMNSPSCEWIENRWWVYRVLLPKPDFDGNRVELVFNGLDYEALIFMNGQKLGVHKGMYHPAVFDVTQMLNACEQIEISVVLKHAPDEMAQIGKTSETFTQKSRFNYKWDFSTRLVNIGIWDDVLLRVHQPLSFDTVHVQTSTEREYGLVRVTGSLTRTAEISSNEATTMTAALIDPQGATVKKELWNVDIDNETFQFDWFVEDPQLWFPNGCGEQPLYRLKLTLNHHHELWDTYSHQIGIRKLTYTHNDQSPQDALPYTFVVNDTKIYIKGVNLVPLDHLYGNVKLEQYEWMLRAAKQGNFNMIRIWGGGIIEKEALYDLCDKYGLLIWQEFIQSSSGVDNIPSKRPEFLQLLRISAEDALKSRRNHVSMAVWSGGNELMNEHNKPSTDEDENLSMLKALVKQHDPDRLFLPTSASGPVEYINDKKGISHDVHGHWKYQGNPDHYRIYAANDCLFHSEFGVDGLSSERSIKKFLSKPYRNPVSMEDSFMWRHHGEWWDTLSRDTILFGEMKELAEFVQCSQWIQAEGLRYILEANMRRKFQNSGSMIWQLNEPWPNVSCTNLIDYYMEPKMAYYWVRKTFAPVHVSLDYKKLNYQPGEQFEEEMHLFCQANNLSVTVKMEVLDSQGNTHAKHAITATGQGNEAVHLGKPRWIVPKTADGLFYVRITAESDVISSLHDNVYIFSACPAPIYASALELPNGRLTVNANSHWTAAAGSSDKEKVWIRSYSLKNEGTDVLLHVYPQELTDNYWILADEAYVSIFPGEERMVQVVVRERVSAVFEKRDEAKPKPEEPHIQFQHMNSKQKQYSMTSK